MTQLEISGSIKNLTTLMNALALPRSSKSSGKGDNFEFRYRKIILGKTSKDVPILAARQQNVSIYSQVLCRSDVETPFVKFNGYGDMMLDMEKTMRYLKELAIYDNATVTHDTDTHQTVFRGSKDSDYEEWYTFEPTQEIDDARNTLDNGQPLTFQTPPTFIPIINGAYNPIGVQFEIDSSVMRTIGDKTENLLDDQYPICFNKDNLMVYAGDPGDISNDSFKKQIPMTYIVNNMVGKKIVLGTDFRNIFGSLDGKLMIQSEDVQEDQQSIYVFKNDIGFHTGIKLQAKGKIV